MLFRLFAMGLLLSLSLVPLAAVPITINIGTPDGILNDAEHGHFITFNTGGGLHILNVTMTVSDGAYFDTQDNTFPDTSLDFAPTNGTAAGVGHLTPPANGVADNGTSFLMTFTPGSFTQGETFSYDLDIDTCNNDNGVLSGEICTASEMIGGADDVFFSVTLAGAGFQNTVVSGFYNFTQSLNREGSGNTTYARVTLTGDAVANTPEPGTFLLFGGGLVALGLGVRHRRT